MRIFFKKNTWVYLFCHNKFTRYSLKDDILIYLVIRWYCYQVQSGCKPHRRRPGDSSINGNIFKIILDFVSLTWDLIIGCWIWFMCNVYCSSESFCDGIIPWWSWEEYFSLSDKSYYCAMDNFSQLHTIRVNFALFALFW